MNTELKIYQAIAVAERFGTVTLGQKNYTAAELRQKVKPMYPLPPFKDSNAYAQRFAARKEELSLESMFDELLKRVERERRKQLH
jgi:hypothetical protein